MAGGETWRVRMTGDLGGIDGLRIQLRATTTGILKQLVSYGESVAKQRAPKDTSGLARAIGSEVQGLNAAVIVPFGAETQRIGQAVTMEFGREPGSKMPPKGTLLGWMRRKGINPKLEFVIRRAIGRDGLKGWHYMQAAADAMVRDLPIIVQQAARDIERKAGRR